MEIAAVAGRQGGAQASARALDKLLFFGVAIAAAIVLVLPIALARYPAMADYANHLARAQIIVDEKLAGHEHPYYAVREALVSNLALDMLVPLGTRTGLSTNDALRIFAALALLLPVIGTIAAGLALQGEIPWLTL